MVGGFLTSLTVYGSNQATVQRYLTMRTVQDAKKLEFDLSLLLTVLKLRFLCLFIKIQIIKMFI